MRFVRFLILLLLFISVQVACGDSDPSSGGGVTATSLDLAPSPLSLAAGTSADVKATVTSSDKSTKDVTASAAWTSREPAIATVTAGKVVAIKAGTATIAATSDGLEKTVTVTVTAPKLVSLAVTPPTPKVAKGLTQALVATGIFSDKTTQDLTKQVTWTSADAAVATVSPAALLTAVKPGTSVVTAKSGDITATTTVTVTDAKLVSIDLTPSAPTVPKGFTKQLTATGTFTDTTTQDITTQVAWTTSSATNATVGASTGLVNAIVKGSSTISATLAGVTGTTLVTVSDAQLVSIGVTPAAPSVAKGLGKQFTATGVYSDVSTQDLTTQVVWTSSDAAKATISNTAGSKGLAKTLAEGTTEISADLGAISGKTTLTVTPAALVSIAVTPAAPSVAKGLTRQFTATGTYTDASTQDLTTQATWESSDLAKATISNAAGSSGLASTAAVGTTTISATLGGVAGSTLLTVTPAALVSIAVTPVTPSVAKGITQQLTAVGTYTDASTQDITTQVTWASSDPAKATISNAAGSRGLATSLGVGSTTISATLSGVTGTTTLTVTPAALVSIAVTPAAPSIAKGLTQQFVATGTYTDASTQNLTTQATWLSSDETKATISNAAGSNGLATAAGIGTASISATHDGKSGATTLTVTAPTVVSIAVTPSPAKVGIGVVRAFTATATLTDASTSDLTETAVWASTDPTKATISNAAGSRGRATGVALGTTTISATSGGKSGTSLLSVVLCNNPGGGPLVKDDGTGTGDLYCYSAGDSIETRAFKACEAHFGAGECCVQTGGYQNQQYGKCDLDGFDPGQSHFHWDNHPNGHCAPNYVVGDVVSPGWCGEVVGNFLN